MPADIASPDPAQLVDRLLHWGLSQGCLAVSGAPEGEGAIHHVQIDADDLLLVLQQVFVLCRQAGLSFILRQRLANGCELELLGRDGAGAHILRLHRRPAPQRRGQWLQRAGWRLLKRPVPGTAAVVGADGSGKTALLDAAAAAAARPPAWRIKNFKRYFRRPLPYLIRRETRNDRDERMLWLILPVAWVYFTVSRWCTGRWQALVLDRYFYDYFVRDVRSPQQPLRRIAAYTACSLLAPCPQRLVVAYCPVELIHQRKLEMSAASIEGLYQVYLQQIVGSAVPATLFCHTGQPLAASGAQALRFLQTPWGAGAS